MRSEIAKELRTLQLREKTARDGAPMPMRGVADAAALGLYMLIAGSAFLFTKDASAKLRPCTIAAIRLSLGGTALGAIHVGVHGGRATVRALRVLRTAPVALVGALNTAVPYSLYAAAMACGVQVWFAAVASGTAPIFAVAFARVVAPSHRRPSRTEVAGLVLGLAGLAALALKKEIAAGHHASAGLDGVPTRDGAAAAAQDGSVATRDGGTRASFGPPWLGPAVLLVAVASKALAAVLAQRLLAGRRGETADGAAQRTGVAEEARAQSIQGGESRQGGADRAAPVSTEGTARQRGGDDACDSADVTPLGFALAQTLWGCALAIFLSAAFDGSRLLIAASAAAARAQLADGLGCWPGAWPALLYLGLASSCAVYVLQFTLLARVGAVRQVRARARALPTSSPRLKALPQPGLQCRMPRALLAPTTAPNMAAHGRLRHARRRRRRGRAARRLCESGRHDGGAASWWLGPRDGRRVLGARGRRAGATRAGGHAGPALAC